MSYDPTQPVPPPIERPPYDPSSLPPPAPPPPPIIPAELPYWQVKNEVQTSTIVAVGCGVLIILLIILAALGVFAVH